MSEITNMVDKLASLKAKMSELKKEYEETESKLYAIAEDALKDTKLKSITYCSDKGNKVTAVIADTISNVCPSLFQSIFGKTYPDFVEEKKEYKLKPAAKRLLSAVWNHEYCKGDINEIINDLPADEKSKKSLTKKLKGVNFETDKKNLRLLGGLDDQAASDNAFLISEIKAWEFIENIMNLNHGNVTEELMKKLDQNVNAAIVVSRSTKLTVEGDKDECNDKQ
ncbi:MAG: hypothetical protein Q4F95_00760 [Oscillospiraceae bacterium]|nr:hypothetical protein [Oscillospiraceae bacterium]